MSYGGFAGRINHEAIVGLEGCVRGVVARVAHAAADVVTPRLQASGIIVGSHCAGRYGRRRVSIGLLGNFTLKLLQDWQQVLGNLKKHGYFFAGRSLVVEVALALGELRTGLLAATVARSDCEGVVLAGMAAAVGGAF